MVDIDLVVKEKKIFKISSMYFCYFVINPPWKKAGPFIWKKLETPLPKNAYWQVWLKLAQWLRRRRYFNFVNIVLLFRNYLPLEMEGALHLNKLEFLSPKDAFCKVWLKLVQWFWRRRFFFRFLQFIFSISWLSPPGKGQGPSFEQTWIPFTQECLVPSLVEIGIVVKEKKIFNFVNVFSLFCNYLSLEKGRALHLNKLKSPLPNDAKFVWNCPNASGEEDF